MASATITAAFSCSVQQVWDVVTSLEHYHWRSDLSRIEIVSDQQFIEYTREGYPTTFTVTAFEPCRRWAFEIDNSNLTGSWEGLFSEKDGQTLIVFTERVSAKKLFMKPFVVPFLKKQQAQYVADLKKALT